MNPRTAFCTPEETGKGKRSYATAFTHRALPFVKASEEAEAAAKKRLAEAQQLMEQMAAINKSLNLTWTGLSALDKLFKEFPFKPTMPVQGAIAEIPQPEHPLWQKPLNFPQTPFAYAGTKEAMEQSKFVSDLTVRWDEYRKIVDEARTPTEAFNEAVANLNNVFLHTDLTVEQYNLALAHIKDSLDPNTIAMRKFGEEAGRTLNAALLFGRSWSEALRSILAALIETILQMTVLKQLQESAGGGGFLGTFLGGLFGAPGHHAYGGDVAANIPILVGEKGPELWVPPAAGHIVRNDQLRGGGSHVYNIDARGADATQLQHLERIIRASHNDAVIKAVYLTKELERRS